MAVDVGAGVVEVVEVGVGAGLVGPVLVTVVPARTAKLAAVPRPTGAFSATAG